MDANTCLHTLSGYDSPFSDEFIEKFCNHCANSIIFAWKRYHHKNKQLNRVAIQNKAIAQNKITVNSTKETSPNKIANYDDKPISNNRMSFDFQERPLPTLAKKLGNKIQNSFLTQSAVLSENKDEDSNSKPKKEFLKRSKKYDPKEAMYIHK